MSDNIWDRPDPIHLSGRRFIHDDDDVQSWTDTANAIVWKVNGYPGTERVARGIHARVDVIVAKGDIGDSSLSSVSIRLEAHTSERAWQNYEILCALVEDFEKVRDAYREAIVFVKDHSIDSEAE